MKESSGIRPSNFRTIGKVDSSGAELFVAENEAGGYTYMSNEIGGGVLVWDTALISRETLMAVIAIEDDRRKEKDA